MSHDSQHSGCQGHSHNGGKRAEVWEDGNGGDSRDSGLDSDCHHPPNKFTNPEVRAGVRDFFEAAVSVAVGSVSASAAAASAAAWEHNTGTHLGGDVPVAYPFRFNPPPLVLDDALDICRRFPSDPKLTWMASTILSDETCWATLNNICIDAGPGANASRTFPHKESVDALMGCLGWASAGSYPTELDGGDCTPATGDRTDRPRGGSEAHIFGKGPGSIGRALRPLFTQTPWPTLRWNSLTFADDQLEAAWMNSVQKVVIAHENSLVVYFGLMNLITMCSGGDLALTVDVLLTFGFGRGSCDISFVQAIYLAVRWLPISYCFFVIGISKILPGWNARQTMCVLYRLIDCALPIRNIYATSLSFDREGNAIVANETRSFFDAGAFADLIGRTWTGMLIVMFLMPYVFTLTFHRHMCMQPVYMLIRYIRFGSAFFVGGCRMFTTWPDVAVRSAVFSVVAALVYLREYYSRLNFLTENLGARAGITSGQRLKTA